ncbi:hypothetical protein SAMN05216232_2440 [Virgibacillus subterraneus]|uniref:Uncharacterized protein n=1 Tax=Virgibacillus subterraneus TaxID=621109 RepID=A0A1H9G3A0_9BACI|nr:hypothetical protein [Virgibacillus subterraneus]SEQ44607.1 hypothetical protein SAMN05216232_2440 [Virgibacillus subterraneus]
MSDNRKVIHVKDLVIKADNVYFDRPDRRRRDPFFGGRQDDDERVEGLESSGHRHRDQNDESSSSDSSDNDNRGPFSWI